MGNPSANRYRGDFVAWTGGCALIGEGQGSIAPHSHYAIQLALGAPSGLRVQIGRGGPWQPCAAALIPSRATHSIDVNGCDWSTVLFIEPETAEGRALTDRLQGKLEVIPADSVAMVVGRLEQAWRVDRSAAALQAVYLDLVRDVSRMAPREPSDPRVLAAIETIRQRGMQPVSLDEVARAVHLSPSRFRHLFVQETGMPLRTYLLWRKLLHVWTLLVQGESLAAAAHEAGFADSAHLSRTARSMFGVPPSILQMNGPISTRIREQHHLA
jgi:AraC family transcriptional regulator